MRRATLAIVAVFLLALPVAAREQVRTFRLDAAPSGTSRDAQQFAAEIEHAAALPGDVELRPSNFRESLTGRHLAFSAYKAGRLVLGAGASLTIARNGDAQVIARLPDSFHATPAAPVPVDPIAYITEAPGPLTVASVDRVWYAAADRLIDADWWIVEHDSLRAWSVITERSSGRALHVEPLFFNVTRAARVFPSNPVQRLDAPSLRDENDSAAAVPDPAYAVVLLQGLDDSGALRGDRVTIAEMSMPENAGIGASDDLTAIDRSDSRFESAVAYHLVDAAQRYLESLGYRGPHRIIDRSIEVDPRAFGGADSSFYVARVAGRGFLAFGTGGTDDAEDADIVHHEFGHAIQDAIAPGTFGGASGTEARALGEGFGDYWAFSAGYSDSVAAGSDPYCLAEWDARCAGSSGCAYPAGSECLRRLDGQRTMASYERANGSGVEHRNGEIWSSTLGRIFESLVSTHGPEEGRRRADTLAIEGHFGVPPSPTFATVAQRMLQADATLYGSESRPALCSAFTQAEILSDSDCGEVRISVMYPSQQVRIIPDNDPAGIELTRLVSDFRTIKRVFIRVEIEHPQRGDLRIVLVAPDGTPAQLLDTSYADVSTGLAVTFGLDAAPTESLDVFRGRVAAGIWTLRVIDTRSRDVGRVLSWGIGFQFEESVSPGKREGEVIAVLPVATSSRGAGGELYSSDLAVTAGDHGALLELWLGESNLAGTPRPLMTTVSVEPRSTVLLRDLVRSLFATGGAGSLEIRRMEGNAVVRSWIVADHPRGELRQAIPAAAEFYDPERLLIAHVSSVSPFRANLGLTEIGGEQVRVRARVHTPDGALAHEQLFELGPWQHAQVPLPAGIEGWADITKVSGSGRIAGYASVIDSRSGDPSLMEARPPQDRHEAPAVARRGAAGSDWITTLHVAAPEGATVTVAARNEIGVHKGFEVFTVPEGGSIVLEDVLGELGLSEFFGRISVSSHLPFVAETRIVNRTSAGTAGQIIRVRDHGTDLVLAPWIVDAQQRTNLLVFNGHGAAAVEVTRRGGDGRIVDTTTYWLDAGRVKLIPLEKTDQGIGRIEVRATGPVAAWLSIVDNRSGDAVTIDSAPHPMKISVRRLQKDLPLPSRATTHAAGFDIHACIESSVTLQPGERALVPTGLALAIPEGFEGQVRPRSGLAAMHGIGVVNAPGTIDSDYRGEVKVILINHGAHPFELHRGDRIAQLVIAPVPPCEIEEVEELPDSVRGEGGFGSTGR